MHPSENLVEDFIFHIPFDVVRGKSFVTHEFGETVIGGSEASSFVEETLHLEHFFADRDNIFTFNVETRYACDRFCHPSPTFGDIKDGEGDEEAVATSVDEGGCRLEGEREIAFGCVV